MGALQPCCRLYISRTAEHTKALQEQQLPSPLPSCLRFLPCPSYPACGRFHAWPEEALVSVARRFLADVPDLGDELRESVAQHMAFAHQSVGAASHK